MYSRESARGRVRYLAVPDDNLPASNKAISLSTPVKIATEVAGCPNHESLEIAQGIEPAKPQCAPVPQQSPSHCNRLNHAVEKCNREHGNRKR